MGAAMEEIQVALVGSASEVITRPCGEHKEVVLFRCVANYVWSHCLVVLRDDLRLIEGDSNNASG